VFRNNYLTVRVRRAIFFATGKNSRATARRLSGALSASGESHVWTEMVCKFWVSGGNVVEVLLQTAAAAGTAVVVERETSLQTHQTAN